MVYLNVMLNIVVVSIVTFWLSVAVSAIMVSVVIPLLRKMRAYKQRDRKETLYGTEAKEFANLRKKEESGIKKHPVPRMGGLVLLPTVFTVGSLLSAYFASPLLFIITLTITAVTLAMLYDDLIDIGVIKRNSLRIRERFFILGVITFVCGLNMFLFVPGVLTLLPFAPFESIAVPLIVMAILFVLWCLFWQASSIIDGVDGLSGSIFIILFAGNLVLSILQGNIIVLLLSLMSIGMLIPWLFSNYAPAKAYLTETGITTLIMLYAINTFLLAIGSGDGIWTAIIFGFILIATWGSNVLQVLYRKRTGKKLFRIAPLHHHFEVLGIPGSAVVLHYTLFTILSFAVGISLFLII